MPALVDLSKHEIIDRLTSIIKDQDAETKRLKQKLVAETNSPPRNRIAEDLQRAIDNVAGLTSNKD